ncbi:General stress protein 16U [compost metagenome]
MALDKLSPQHVEWHIYMFIHKAAERGQNFGAIRNARFELLNGDTGESMVHYQVTQTFSTETALHVASVIRNAAGEYEVHPVGDAGCMDPNEVAGAYI